MLWSNKFYDAVKKALTVYIPAFNALFITLVNIWKWDIPVESIVATICAVSTFLGIAMGISSGNFKQEGSK